MAKKAKLYSQIYEEFTQIRSDAAVESNGSRLARLNRGKRKDHPPKFVILDKSAAEPVKPLPDEAITRQKYRLNEKSKRLDKRTS